MRHKQVVLMIAAALVTIGISVIAAADTRFILPGLEGGETVSLPRLMALERVDEEAALRLSEDILRETPENPAVFYFRSELLLNLGRLDEAAKTVSLLKETKPYWVLTWQLQGDLLDAMGEYKKEADVLESFLREEFPEPREAAYAEATRKDLPSRIAELRGKIEEAETAWKALVEDSKNANTGTMEEVGKFYLRHGQDAKAERMFRSALENGGKTFGDYSQVDSLLMLVHALWVQGKLDEAATAAKDMVNICERLPLDSDLCFSALLTSHMVFKQAHDKEAAAHVESLLEKAAGMDNLAKRIAGLAPLVRDLWKDRDAKAAADRTRAVLQKAPRLDWALWSALYLGLAEPDKAGDLLKLLPKGSIQQRIAEAEAKARVEKK